jgi:signal peptidase II
MKNIKNFFSFFLKKENISVIVLIFITFSLDRFAKIKIINDYNVNVIFINDFINFNLIWNTGIGFGLLNFDSTLIYNLITLLIGTVILVLLYILINSDKLDKLIFSIIVGGALGNFYDRLSYSAVPDFIDLYYKNFHWFTFNVADIFITIGIITYIMKGYLVKKIK